MFKHSILISKETGINVYLKYINLQKTGSFKFRWVLNKLLSINDKDSVISIISALTWNHGAAVAYDCKILNLKCQLFSPNKAFKNKLEEIKNYGAKIKYFDNDCLDTEREERIKLKKNKKFTYLLITTKTLL